jgi:pimeloyl-ACP methyl ester carboxylesterase
MRLGRVLVWSILVLAVLYAGLVGALYLAQDRLLYPVAGQPVASITADVAGFETLRLDTLDGERLVAWWKAPEAGKMVILYFPGNDDPSNTRRERARLLGATGHGVLMVAYRGFWGSTGWPHEAGLHTDARTAYAWLAGRVLPSRTVLFGESLGSGVAVRLATEARAAGLILDAPYTTTAAVAADRYPFVPVHWLMRDQYRSIDIIGRVKVPLLVLHGSEDQDIPIRYGEALYQAATAPKRFVGVEGAGHTTLLAPGGLPAVEAFLASLNP